MKRVFVIVLVIGMILSVVSCSDTRATSDANNKYEEKIIQVRDQLKKLADGETTYDKVKEDFGPLFSDEDIDRLANFIPVIYFVVLEESIIKLGEDKEVLEMFNKRIRLIDYKNQSKAEINEMYSSMRTFAKQHDVDIYVYSNDKLKFSEPTADINGYGTHKIFTREKWKDDYYIYGVYIFDKQDKILAHTFVVCKEGSDEMKKFLQKEVRFKE